MISLERERGHGVRQSRRLPQPSFEALKRGDKEEWSKWVANTSPLLLGFITQRLGDLHEAEDLLQNAWARVNRRMPEITDDINLNGYVIKTVHRLLIDRHNGHRRHEISVPPEQITIFEAPAPDNVEKDALERVSTTTMKTFIDTLSDKDKEHISLFIAGLSFAEMAQHYGVTAETIRLRHQATLARIKRRAHKANAQERNTFFADILLSENSTS